MLEYANEIRNMPLTVEINTKGHLCVGGCDVVDLAGTYGTPLYVMDEETLRQNCRNYIDAFSAAFPGSRVVFASKALSVRAVLEVINEEGLEIDVVSGGELHMATLAGFPGAKIWFHGNNKSEKELQEALNCDVGHYVVDNPYEVDLLDRTAKKAGKVANVLLRMTPGIEAHTHEYIQTGQLDSKFGIHPDQIINVIKLVQEKKNLAFKGLHVHIGSQILEIKPYSVLAEVVFNILNEIKQRLKIEIEELNLGGGLGINYLERDNAPLPQALAETISSTIQFKAREFKLNVPRIIVEPGRSIVGSAGMTLYTIGATKELKGIRKFAFVDGGMADNIRPALYSAEYHAVIANKIGEKKKEIYSVAGKFCESGDILMRDIQIQHPDPQDVLAVFATGAYNYSMASNYNQSLRPAMVLVKGGKVQEIVERETYEDLARHHRGYVS